MISKIVKHNGNRMFEIDGKLYTPAAFRSFRPTPANISLFYRNGIRLFQFQCSGLNSNLGIPYSNFGGAWVGDHQYDFTVLDRQINMFMRFAPEGYFMLMVQLDTPSWWLEENKCPWNSFTKIGEAFYEKKWIDDACDYLKAILQYAEEKYGDRIFGYSFSAGCSTEWFDTWYTSISDRKASEYRQSVGDPNAPIPTREEVRSTDLPLLRDDDDPVYRYQKYCSTLTPQLILRFASAAQEVIRHQKVLGIFFGYTDLPVNWQNQTATNGYETVWHSHDLDMLFSPASYQTRTLDRVSSYQYTVDSVALHNKLYLHEIDHQTYLAEYPFDNFNKGFTSLYKDATETIRVLRREMCAAAVKDGALCWFDFTGGYYASPELEAELRKETKIIDRLYRMPHESVSEIAVFVDPMSFLRMKDASSVTGDCVWHNRDALHNCGAPFDYFNLNDITKVNTKQYKVYIFLNALEMSDEVKSFIKSELSDALKVWGYAPNFATGGAEEVCGIRLCEYTDPLAKVQYKDDTFGFESPVQPLYAVNDPDAEILACYTDGTPACARKGKDVYLAVGKIPHTLWRDIARAAGVHIYSETPGALYVDSRFVARQNINESDFTISLPFDCELEELFDGGIYRTDHKTLRYHAENGDMKLFVIRKKL